MLRVKAAFKNLSNRLPAISQALKRLNNAQAIIGWEGDETYPGTDMTVAQVAIFNEYGTKGRNGRGAIPARPFMRQAYAKNLKATVAAQALAYDKVMKGEWSVEKGLTMLGFRFQEAVRSEIVRGNFAANRARTLERKKERGQGGRPLIATRRMLNALRFRIELNGKALAEERAADRSAAGAASQKASEGKQSARAAAIKDRRTASRERAQDRKAIKRAALKARKAESQKTKLARARNHKAVMKGKKLDRKRIVRARRDARKAFKNFPSSDE